VSSTPQEKPVRWEGGEVKSPPFSFEARLETGGYLGQLQQGEKLSMPVSRPMPSIGPGCHELRIRDGNKKWRIVYYIDSECILVLEVFQKTTRTTPKAVIDICKKRLSDYQSEKRGRTNDGH